MGWYVIIGGETSPFSQKLVMQLRRRGAYLAPIGLVGFDSPSPLVGKLIVLGAGIAVTGGLMRHRLTLWVGVGCALSSLLLRQISTTLQPVIFGVVTLISMTMPSLLLSIRQIFIRLTSSAR